MNKDNEIIGLHFEIDVGLELGTQSIMNFKDIQELIEDKFCELLQDEGVIPLGGKCYFIRKNNEYGIKVREDV